MKWFDCAKFYNQYMDIKMDDTMICAQSPGKGVTHGDSGGPLMTFLHGNRLMWGMTSWGSTDRPAVFMRMASYYDWIRDTIKRET